MNISKVFNEFISIVAVLVLVIAPAIAGVAMLGWQIFGYLSDGVWHPYSVVDVLASLQVQWAAAPHAWLGVHEILAGTPLFAGLWAFAFLGLFAVSLVE